MADPKDITPDGGTNEATTPTPPPAGDSGTSTGGSSGVTSTTAITTNQAAIDEFNNIVKLEDKTYTLNIVSNQSAGRGFSELQIDQGSRRNNTTDGQPSILLNSSRVIINSKADYTIVAGEKGVSISSPNRVNIDADDNICLFGAEGVFLGVPNRGEPKPLQPSEQIEKTDVKYYKNGKKLKSHPVDNEDYEPMVLGLKLVEWLDDLCAVLKTAVINTGLSEGNFNIGSQYDFVALQSRVKEMLSTYAYVDGWSHELPDDPPKPPTDDQYKKQIPKPNISIDVSGLKIKLPPGLGGGAGADPMTSKPDYFTSTDVNYTITAI